jgi:hypothetical protein
MQHLGVKDECGSASTPDSVEPNLHPFMLSPCCLPAQLEAIREERGRVEEVGRLVKSASDKLGLLI